MESVNLSTISSKIPNRGRPRKIDKSIFCNLNVHLTVKHNRVLTKYIGPKTLLTNCQLFISILRDWSDKRVIIFEASKAFDFN